MQKGGYFIKILIVLIFLIFFYGGYQAFAFSIIIKNETGAPLRIDSFENNCGKILIEDTNPLLLSSGESIKFDNVMPIMHHYRMCANGTCEGSALGMTLNIEKYIIVVTLKNQCICVTQNPLIWPGRFQCNNAQFEI